MSAGETVVHQAPQGAELSGDYQVKANGAPAPVYRGTVYDQVGAPLGPLGAPSERAKDSAHMSAMVRDPKPLTHHLGDPRTGPQVRWKTRRLRPLEQNPLQAFTPGGGQFQRTPRGLPRAERPFPSPAARGFPSPYAPSLHADHPRNFNQSLAVFQQRDGPLTTTLQFLRTAGRSHGSPPAQSIGHYLCRRQ